MKNSKFQYLYLIFDLNLFKKNKMSPFPERASDDGDAAQIAVERAFAHPHQQLHIAH